MIPSNTEIQQVVASEIECDNESIEGLADRLIERADSSRKHQPCDPWSARLRNPIAWEAYCHEVDRQVRELLNVEQQLKDDPPQPAARSTRQPAPPPPLIHARIVDGFDGGRLLAFLRGVTPEWCCNVQALTADLIVEAVARIFRKEPDARIALDVTTCPSPIWRVALLHVLPIHRQCESTPAGVVRFLNELIANGKALADLGLDEGAGGAWADPAGKSRQSFAVTECNRLSGEIGRLRATNARLQGELAGAAPGVVATLATVVDKIKGERDELKRALELARAAAAAPPADAPAPASPPDPADVYNSRLANAMTLLDHAKAHLVAARADAPAGTFDSNRLPAGMRVSEVDAVFDRGRGRKTPRLIGFEDQHGEDRVVGRWIEPSGDPDDDPYWRLRLTVLLPARKEASATG